MKLVPTSLTRFQLDNKEEQDAQKFSQLQQAFLQNLLADSAENLIELNFDPAKPQEFMQSEAYLRGKIDVLKLLLSFSQE